VDNQKLDIAWVDNGSVDAAFASNLMTVVMSAMKAGMNINVLHRAASCNIASNRESVTTSWYEKSDADWLLCLDTDIELTWEVFQMLWEARDAVERPIISGLYFVFNSGETSMGEAIPCIYQLGEEGMVPARSFPPSSLIRCEAAGFGIILMHRSVVKAILENYPDGLLYEEQRLPIFIGEDIAFFKKVKELDIPFYCHTGALVRHWKRFSLDHEYYKAWWKTQTG
jgi:hypothetical protein